MSLKNIIEYSKSVSNAILGEFSNGRRIISEFDISIISLLLEVTNKSESFLVLYEQDLEAGTESLARSILEATFYIRFILDDDSEKAGKAYYYKAKINDIEYFHFITGDSNNSQKARKKYQINKDDVVNEAISLNYQEKADYWKKEYDSCFDNPKDNRNWYNTDGQTRNFFYLSKKLGYVEEYNIFFRNYSHDIHNVNWSKYIVKNENHICFHTPHVSKLTFNVVKKYLYESAAYCQAYYDVSPSYIYST